MCGGGGRKDICTGHPPTPNKSGGGGGYIPPSPGIYASEFVCVCVCAGGGGGMRRWRKADAYLKCPHIETRMQYAKSM